MYSARPRPATTNELNPGDRVTIQITGTVRRKLARGYYVLQADRNHTMMAFDPNYMELINITPGGGAKTQ